MKYVVYTSVFEGYDHIFPPLDIEENLSYVIFTDDRDLYVRGWKTVTVDSGRFRDARAANRYYKMLAHKELSDFDCSLYIDANIRLLGETSSIIEKFQSSGSCLGLFPHPLRTSVLEEAEMCIQSGKIGDSLALESELALYREDGFPDDTGLVEGGINFKNHHHPDLPHAMELWWFLFERFGTRDQISLPYVLWKTGVPCAYQAFSFREPNPYFGIYLHKGDVRTPRFYAYIEGRAYDNLFYAFILRAWHFSWKIRRGIRKRFKSERVR